MALLPSLEMTLAFAGMCIFICGVMAIAAMTAKTRHCFRMVYGLLAVAGLALMLSPIYGTDYLIGACTALAVAVAFYMILDRRRIDRIRA
jgi:hypothetical protein